MVWQLVDSNGPQNLLAPALCWRHPHQQPHHYYCITSFPITYRFTNNTADFPTEGQIKELAETAPYCLVWQICANPKITLVLTLVPSRPTHWKSFSNCHFPWTTIIWHVWWKTAPSLQLLESHPYLKVKKKKSVDSDVTIVKCKLPKKKGKT